MVAQSRNDPTDSDASGGPVAGDSDEAGEYHLDRDDRGTPSADSPDDSGRDEPDDLVWLAKWILCRALHFTSDAKEVSVRSLKEQTEIAFLTGLVSQVEEFVSRQSLVHDSSYTLTQFDADLVSVRERLTKVFQEEKERKKHPPHRLSIEELRERAWHRLMALTTGGYLPPLDSNQLEKLRVYEVHRAPAVDAASLLGKLGFKSVRFQDEAKSKMKRLVRPKPVDDLVLLKFVVKRLLDHGEAVQQAVCAAWKEASEEEARSTEIE